MNLGHFFLFSVNCFSFILTLILNYYVMMFNQTCDGFSLMLLFLQVLSKMSFQLWTYWGLLIHFWAPFLSSSKEKEFLIGWSIQSISYPFNNDSWTQDIWFPSILRFFTRPKLFFSQRSDVRASEWIEQMNEWIFAIHKTVQDCLCCVQEKTGCNHNLWYFSLKYK